MAQSIEFEGKWQELKKRFEEKLVGRFQAIDMAWQALTSRPDDEQALSALFHQVHSLAGSGATFGYEDLSSLSRGLEPLIDPQGEMRGKPLEGARRAAVEARLMALRSQARAINAQI
jgi:chemotaxis protein histidine kinase CheA